MFYEQFSLNDYLQRIGLNDDGLAADLGSLTKIMKYQIRSVPFENLDVQAGKIILLEPSDIFEKIVHNQRGGYCYEVNGIFAMALHALGFKYQFVAARPMFYPVLRPKTHMAIIVYIDGEKYLCDLGFGSHGIRLPLLIDDEKAKTGYEIVQECDQYRISKIEKEHYLLEAFNGGEWARQYSFDLYEPEWIDFAPANFLNSRHPDAIFTKAPLIVLLTDNGRKILFGNSLKIIENCKTEQIIFEPFEYDEILKSHFNLVRPD